MVSEAKRQCIQEGHHRPTNEQIATRAEVTVDKLERLLYSARTPLSMQQLMWTDQHTTFHSCRCKSWINAANHINLLPVLMRSDDVKDTGQVFVILLKSHFDKFGKFIKRVVVSDRGENEVSKLRAKRVSKQVV